MSLTYHRICRGLSLTAARTLLLLTLCPLATTAQQGHIITDNEILIDRRSLWEGWTVAGGTVEISPGGTVRPRFIRKNINAALDAPRFSSEDAQGGTIAGSNARDGRLIIDGDMSTTWGPDSNDSLGDWWIELNLGRIVVVQKIVLRFAAEGEGDPFLQFQVRGWRSPPSRLASEAFLSGTDIPKFWEIGRTHSPNKTQRVFELFPDFRAQNAVGSPESQISTNDLFTGDPLERIQIVITDSDFDRAAEITSEAEYFALGDDEQGAVVHYRQEPSGRETEIPKEEYEAIDPQRRGRIRYYRREVPRLAEIEVWTAGDNLTLGLLDRGGFITVESNNGVVKNIGSTASDGRYSTGYTGNIFGGFIYDTFVHLGALYWIDTLHFLNDGKSGFEHMALDVSDGTRAPNGSIQWTRVVGSVADVASLRRSGIESPKFREFRIEPTRVRYIRAPFGTPVDLGGQTRTGLRFISLTELLIYGEGYVSEVELTSDLIQMGDSKNLISIEWKADTPPGTIVQLRTRSGNTLEEIPVHHDSDGLVITAAKYNRLPAAKQGEITTLFQTGGDWSTWSTPYIASGADIASPSPRRYLEIRATLSSERPDVAASLSSIVVNLGDPVADRLTAEIWPIEIDSLGRPRELSLFIRPAFATSGQGFDELRIEASGRADLELIEALAGSDGDFRNGDATIFPVSDLEVMESAASTVWFRLPAALSRGIDLVEVRFRATTFSTSTSFVTSGQDSDAPGLWQRVDAGDATNLVNSQTTTVLAIGGNRVIRDLTASTEVLTPNGDGVNDEMVFHFSVTRISAEQAVTLRIYDLAGAVVSALSERRADPRGSYAMEWTGADASGALVPPGIYIARLEVDVQSETASATSAQRIVHVAY